MIYPGTAPPTAESNRHGFLGGHLRTLSTTEKLGDRDAANVEGQLAFAAAHETRVLILSILLCSFAFS